MRENARGNSENRASPVSLSFALSLFLPLSLSPFPSPLPLSLYLALSRVIPASAEEAGRGEWLDGVGDWRIDCGRRERARLRRYYTRHMHFLNFPFPPAVHPREET